MKKRLLCFFLCFVMLLSVLPAVPAFADTNSLEVDSYPESSIDIYRSNTVSSWKEHTFTFSGYAWTTKVYVPKNYSKSDDTVYNVCVIMGGSGYGLDTFYRGNYGLALFDYLYDKNLIEPTIFATVEYSSKAYEDAYGLGQSLIMGRETAFFEALIKVIQDNYKVYGPKYVPSDDLSNHYALCGYSSGAAMTQKVMGINPLCFTFGYYGVMSPQGSMNQYAIDNINNVWGGAKKKIKVLFCSAGSGDDTLADQGIPGNEKWARSGCRTILASFTDTAEHTQYVHCTNQNYTHSNTHNFNAAIYYFSQFLFTKSTSITVVGGENEELPEDTYDGSLILYTKNPQEAIDSMCGEYGWDRAYINAAEWIQRSGTYRRPQGHEAELFEDSLYAAEDTCVDLGILPKAYHTSMMSGSLSMVGVALREVNAKDNSDINGNVKYTKPFGIDSYRANWSTSFVAWCANECGYVESGLFPSTNLVNKAFDYHIETNGFDWFDAYQAKPFGGTRDVEAGDLFFFERQLLDGEDLNKACNDVTYGRVGIITSVTPNSILVTQGAVEINDVKTVATVEYTTRDFETILSVNHGAIVHVEYPMTALLFDGVRIDIPIDDGNIFNFEGWQNNTAESRQLDLRRATGDPFDSEGFGCINGRYVVAVTDTFGEVGDYVDFYLEDGTVIPCVIGDIKSRGDWNWCEWGHKKYHSSDESSYFGVCVLEFCVNNPTIENPGAWNAETFDGIPNWYYQPYGRGNGFSHPNPGTSGCKPEWEGKAVKYAIRGGNYFYDPTGATAPGELGGSFGGSGGQPGGELTQAQQDIVNFAIMCYETNGAVLAGTGYEVGCAGFCMRVYWNAPHGDGSGRGYFCEGRNAIDYWRDFQSMGNPTRAVIPVGALVVSAAGQPGDNNGGRYGHVGIYIGNGEVIHYSGRVYRHSLANFIGFCGGSGAWTIADDGNHYHGYQGWIWPGQALGTYADSTGLTDP